MSSSSTSGMEGNTLRQRNQPKPDFPLSDHDSGKKKEGKKSGPNRVTHQKISSIPVPTYYISAWIFGRCMGLLYVISFISIWVQVHGLIGNSGISPMAEYFTRLSTSIALEASIWTHPSIFWIDQSDQLLHAICAIGTVSGIGLFVDVFPFICTSICWILYLSLSVAGQGFFMYQWDLLLLESGFLMIFFHSFHWNWRPFSQNPRDFHPPDALFWLFRLLLFRIHFSRGIQELLSKDRVWRTLTAFDFLFETQPAPTFFSYYLHQLPSLFHQGMIFWILTVEIGVVFLVFGPQLFRRTAFVYLFLLHVFYLLIGNFGTFHWNVGILCILLLDDALFPSLIRKLTRVRRRKLNAKGTKKSTSSQPRLWHRRLSITLAVSIILLSTVPLSNVTKSVSTPQPLLNAYKTVYPFKIVNLYGPFHRIPHERFELRIQASLDAQNWTDYEFLYKPDNDVSKWPPFVSPHISRLEYQLWNAAQSDYQQAVWISRLLHRVLEDSPSVVNLFKKEPFTQVPEYIRATRMKYTFTDMFGSNNNSTAWWNTEFHDIYTPSFSQTVHSMSNRRKNLRSRLI